MGQPSQLLRLRTVLFSSLVQGTTDNSFPPLVFRWSLRSRNFSRPSLVQGGGKTDEGCECSTVYVSIPPCLCSTLSLFHFFVFLTVSMFHTACSAFSVFSPVSVPPCLYSIVLIFHHIWIPPCLCSTASRYVPPCVCSMVSVFPLCL